MQAKRDRHDHISPLKEQTDSNVQGELLEVTTKCARSKINSAQSKMQPDTCMTFSAAHKIVLLSTRTCCLAH